ncbi:MAG: hypothetical protein WC874_00875, partial [Candidatus Izemoplasmatales bacterium]
MGITDSLRDTYYAAEDKWYGMVDALHLSGVVEKIDGIVPSFVLVLALIILVVLFGAYLILSEGMPQLTDARFVVKGSNELVIQGIDLSLTIEGKTLKETTNANGEAIFRSLEVGKSVVVDINSSRGSFHREYTLEQNFSETIILLAQQGLLSPVKRRVTLSDSAGFRIEENIPLRFYCQNSAVQPDPVNITDDGDGLVEVTEPLNCGKLYMKVLSDNYQQKEYLIDSTLKEVTLLPYSAPVKSLTVMVQYNGRPVNGNEFKVLISNSKNDYSQVTTNSVATIDVVPGNYTLSVSDPNGNYGIVTKNITVVNEGTETIDVSKTVKAKITISILDNGTGGVINGASVSLRNALGIELARNDDVNGAVIFSITDLGAYQVIAKKVGDLGLGYSAKIVDLNNVTSDISVTIRLDLVTTANAGRVRVRVVDQDNMPVNNAKIALKYASNDSIVELNQSKNYSVSDLNGYANLLAGKVDGRVVAYAIKYPFNGVSTPKEILIDQLNEFTVKMALGTTIATINVKDETGNLVNGEVEFFDLSGNSVSGIVSLENGLAQKQIKAGQTVYVVVRAEDDEGEAYENYISAPITLWPDKQAIFNAVVYKRVLAPSVSLGGIYNSDDEQVQSLEAGKNYYAKMITRSDETYSDAIMHFRAGEENFVDNDFLEIDKVEGADVWGVVRGATYDPEQGYDYDSQNLTDGPAKWVNVEWKNNSFGRGTREVKIWFRVKPETPPNQMLKLFWRMELDDARLPESVTSQDLYADTYSATYYEGYSDNCIDEFCFTSEWLYSKKDELYLNAPYQMKQVLKYDYHFQIINNSAYDYVKGNKPIYLYIEVVGDESDNKRIRIEDYKIKDALGIVDSNKEVFEIHRVELNSFEKKTSIDAAMTLAGISEGAETIRVRLQSEGEEIFSKDISITVMTEKELNVKVEPDFVPALGNTPLKVTVKDNKNSPVKDASVRLKIRDEGYEDLLFDEAKSDRKGEATVDTGAQYPNTTVVIEVQKEGFAIKELTFVVSDKVVEFDPEEASIALNTVKKREATQSEKITNLTKNDLKIHGITIDAKFEGLINEGALKAYLEELSDENIAGEDTTKLDLIKIRLANDITPENFIDAATIDGKLLVSFETADTHIRYDVELPLTLNITSEASVNGSDCLIIDNPTQSKVTQQGRVSFSFVMTNACNSDEIPIGLENLKASVNGELMGMAELSLQSLGGGTTGRTALDQTQRLTYGKVLPGEKIAGTVTYVPSQDAVGNSITLAVAIEGTYAGKKLRTSPATTNFSVDVINLKECMSISSEPGPVAFDASTTVTVDSSACSKQQVDVILCMGDSGCSGGAEGTVTLSKKTFTLKETSETITVASPSIPGAYGISVYARVRKSGAYIYIGEVPVFFNPSESKYFKLNKYELNLYGKGSRDTAVLTNKMLFESVNVKADECAWGEEDTGFDWASGLVGAVAGGGLAYMTTTVFPIASMTYGGWVVGGITVVGGLVGLLVGGNMGSYDCSDHYQVNPMNDFVIFLQGDKINVHGEQKDIPSDAGALGFSLGKINAGWNFEDAEYSLEETAGINFSNSGLNDPKPRYGLLTVNATEHIHGDQLHTKRFSATSSTATPSSTPASTTSPGGVSTSATAPEQTRVSFSLFGSDAPEEDTSDFDVFCQNENFGKYWIGAGDDQGACEGAADAEYSQQFRMRVLSGEPVDQEAYLKKATSCYNGAVAGATGVDAVPRISLNWKWADIKKNTCDYDNKDYVYCDASQFSIEVIKKLEILNEFFKQNPSFDCPVDPFMVQMQEQIDMVNGAQASISSGTIGVKEITTVVDPDTDKATITVQVENKMAIPTLATVTAVIRGQNTSSPETKNQTFAVGTTNVIFPANTPKYNGAYFVSAAVTGTGANNQSVTRIFVNKESSTACWIEPSTKVVGGKPAIFYYIDTNNVGNVAWTKDIPTLEALHNALLFKAYLMKDGYGQEFRKDFRDYYLETFLQTPPTDAQKNLVDQFDSTKFSFRKKYLNTTSMEAGLYEVRFNIDSNGDFTILKSDGKLNGTIEVELLLVKKPTVDYPFYSMPFDGVLGKTEGRNGYGAAYSNENEALALGGGATTFESATGNGIVEIKTRIPSDLASINSFAGTRGQLLSASATGSSGEIVFSPNYATPVGGKFSLNAGSSGIFGFTVNENGAPKLTGGNMTYWTGAAKSKTFYGANAVQVYNDSPDYQLDETS